MTLLQRPLPLLLAVCSAAAAFAPIANAQLSVDNQDRAAVAAFYRTWFAPANRNVNPGWTGSTTGCNAGDMDAFYRTAIVDRINAYRALLDRANVADQSGSTFSGMDEQRAAMLLQISGQLGVRTLARSTPCWTQDADRALVNSYQDDAVGTDAIDRAMRGGSGAYNQSVLMQPTTVRMRIGSTDSHLLINRPDMQDVFPNTGSVAWPGAGFQPYQLVPDVWCFNAQSLPWDPTITNRNDFFDQATVTVRRNGVPLNITVAQKQRRAWTWDGLTWTFAPGQLQHGPGMGDVTYDVRIDGILGIITSYSYSVTVFDPTPQASSATFGSGCGTGFGTTLNAAPGSRPVLGAAFGVVFSGINPRGDIGILNLGLSRIDTDLTPIGLPGCSAYTDILVTLGTIVNTPSVSFSIPLPSDPSLVGGTFFLQGAAVDPIGNPGGLVTSNGLRATVGF